MAKLHHITILLLVWRSSSVLCDNHVHEDILKWWDKISVKKPLKCQHQDDSWNTLHPVAKEIFIQQGFNSVQIVQSRPCEEGEIPAYFEWKGKVVNDRFEGPGKLKVPLKMPTTATEEDLSLGTACLEVKPMKGKLFTELVGTFVNGTLEGMAKVNFDGSMIIGNFKAGNPLGQRRIWNREGDLVQMFYSNIRPFGWGWHRYGDYLILTEDTFIKEDDEEPFSVLVPLNKEEEILVGTFQTHLMSFEDIHGADVEITSSPDSCILRLNWSAKGKKDFKYHITSKQKIPIFYQMEPNCKANQTEGSSLDEQLTTWNEFVNSAVINHEISGFQNLHYTKPETSPVDHDKVKQPFITDPILIPGKFQYNFTVWGGQLPTTWTILYLSLDLNAQLHGLCGFQIVNEHINLTGHHDLLQWSPKNIVGRFIHGKLHGVAAMVTWRGNYLFPTFKDGVIHGPVYGYGQTSILNMEVIHHHKYICSLILVVLSF
jgi:hypothetical protein